MWDDRSWRVRKPDVMDRQESTGQDRKYPPAKDKGREDLRTTPLVVLHALLLVCYCALFSHPLPDVPVQMFMKHVLVG
jgi:hypothetical protein